MQIKKIASFDVRDGASTVRYADLDDGISFFPTDGIINIKSNKVRIAGFGVDANSLYRIDSLGAMYPLGDSNSVFLSNEGLWSSASIGGSSGSNKWVLAISDDFGVTDGGTLYARNANITGTINATSGKFSGEINAERGSIGGWVITNNSLKSEGSGWAAWTHYISKITPDEFTIQYNDSGIGIGESWSGNYYLRSAGSNIASYVYGEPHSLRLRTYKLFSGDSVEKFSVTKQETPKTPQYESYIEIGDHSISIESYEHNNNSEGEGMYYGGYKNERGINIDQNSIYFTINKKQMISFDSNGSTIYYANLNDVNNLRFKDGSMLTNLRNYSLVSNYIEFTFIDGAITDVLGVTCWKSDKNLKTNIVDTSVNATSILKDIRFKQFDWIKTGIHETIGVIAQDLEKIDKNLVIKLNNPNGGFTYQINPNEFAIITAKSLQEQITRIDNMEININNKILQTKNDLLLENQKLKDKLSFLEEKIKYMNGEKSSYSE